MQLVPCGIVAENTHTHTQIYVNWTKKGGKLIKSQKTEGLNSPSEYQKYSYFNTAEEHSPTFYGCGHNVNFDVNLV